MGQQLREVRGRAGNRSFPQWVPSAWGQEWGSEGGVSGTFAALAVGSQHEARGAGAAVGAQGVLTRVLAQAARRAPALVHICGRAAQGGWPAAPMGWPGGQLPPPPGRRGGWVRPGTWSGKRSREKTGAEKGSRGAGRRQRQRDGRTQRGAGKEGARDQRRASGQQQQSSRGAQQEGGGRERPAGWPGQVHSTQGTRPPGPTYPRRPGRRRPAGSQLCSHSGRSRGGCDTPAPRHTGARRSHTRSRLPEGGEESVLRPQLSLRKGLPQA